MTKKMKREFPYRTQQEFFANVSKERHREPRNSYNLNRSGRLVEAIKRYY